MLIIELIAIQMLVFLVIFFTMRHLMYKNTMNAVNHLKVADEENEKKLKELRKNISEAEETYQKRLAEVSEEVQKQREAANQMMDTEKEKILSKAKLEANALIETAKGRVQRMAREEEETIRNRALSLAGKAICRLLSEETHTVFHEQIVEELLKEVETMDVTGINVLEKNVKVISRYPLLPHQKIRLNETLEKKLGPDIEIQETVREEMAGGLILTAGSLVIDGSLEGRLKNLIQKMEAASE